MLRGRGVYSYGTAAVFLALCALWLWCGRGGRAMIRVVAAGDKVEMYFDGRLVAAGRDAGLDPEGGIGIWYNRDSHWGMPVPQTLESARVTDNATGALLLNQDFRQPLSDVWIERPASCEPSRGGLRCDRAGSVRLCTGRRPWRDYTLELRVRNPMSINVAVRYRDPANHAVFFARPFRDLDAGLTFVIGGAPRTIGGGASYYPARMAAKNALLVFIYWFPWCVLAIAALFAAGCLLGVAASHLAVSRTVLEAVFVALLFAGGVVYLSWITRSLLDGIPHVQDSVVYNFQAQTLARGTLYAPAPPNPPSFEFQFLVVKDGKWFGQYPWGHPLLLMFGHLVRAPWIIPPLVGASVLVLIYLIARELYSREVAAVSALLAFFSPFFQVNAPNFMSHSSASFYCALGIFGLIKASRGRARWWGFLSGFALGLLFNTRPLNAVPAIVLSLAMLLYFACRGKARWGSLAGFCAGGLLTAAFYLYANYVLMGNPLHPPYALVAQPISFFGESHPLGAALLHFYASMVLFVMVIFGWAPAFTVGFFLAFLLTKKGAWSIYLFLLFVGMTLINTLNPAMVSVAHMYGPRYVYEPFFVFIIMAACGWDGVRRLVERGIDLCAAAFPLRARLLSWGAHAAFLTLLAALVFGAQQKWLSRSETLFNIAFMPGNVFGLKGFNYTSGEMLAKIRSRGIHHALLFVEDREFDWWYYGAVFTLNSPFLDSDVIVARDRGPQANQGVIAAFPGRRLFRVNVRRREIRDYGWAAHGPVRGGMAGRAGADANRAGSSPRAGPGRTGSISEAQV